MNYRDRRAPNGGDFDANGLTIGVSALKRSRSGDRNPADPVRLLACYEWHSDGARSGDDPVDWPE